MNNMAHSIYSSHFPILLDIMTLFMTCFYACKVLSLNDCNRLCERERVVLIFNALIGEKQQVVILVLQACVMRIFCHTLTRIGAKFRALVFAMDVSEYYSGYRGTKCLSYVFRAYFEIYFLKILSVIMLLFETIIII